MQVVFVSGNSCLAAWCLSVWEMWSMGRAEKSATIYDTTKISQHWSPSWLRWRVSRYFCRTIVTCPAPCKKRGCSDARDAIGDVRHCNSWDIYCCRFMVSNKDCLRCSTSRVVLISLLLVLLSLLLFALLILFYWFRYWSLFSFRCWIYCLYDCYSDCQLHYCLTTCSITFGIDGWPWIYRLPAYFFDCRDSIVH